jgi:lipopolysaccharide transport system permease protein
MRDHARWLFLFRQLLARELASRYRTTALGTVWLVLQPLLMLCVYTLVFGGIFKVRWANASTTADFALVLFAGLLIFNFFSEVLVTAPMLIVGQPNYIKKVVFPVAMLPIVRVAAAMVTALISLGILLMAQWWISGRVPMRAILAPVVLIEMVPLLLGIAWMISSLGVYLRDISQFIGIVASVMLFLSPIFFPPSSIPSNLSFVVDLNPLVKPMQVLRALTVQSDQADWPGLGVHFIMSLGFAWLSLALFRRLSRGFADVL